MIDWRGVRISDPEGVAYRTLFGHLSGVNNRTIIDKTGLTGTYDAHLQWERDPAATAPGDALAQPAPAGLHAPSLFDAVEKQLGLRLESGRGPVEHLVGGSGREAFAKQYVAAGWMGTSPAQGEIT